MSLAFPSDRVGSRLEQVSPQVAAQRVSRCGLGAVTIRYDDLLQSDVLKRQGQQGPPTTSSLVPTSPPAITTSSCLQRGLSDRPLGPPSTHCGHSAASEGHCAVLQILTWQPP
jgi:hypothetical protein